MKITVITGSAHKHGTTAYLADEFIRGAKEAEHDIYRFEAGNANIHPCIACETCNTKNTGCVFKDDMEILNPHLINADAIVLVSPIYYYDINAQLKAVIDRFYANNSKLQGNKKTALLVACADDTMESVDGAVVSFERFSTYMKWDVAGMVTANNSWTVEDLKNTEYPEKAYELGKNIFSAVAGR